MSTDALNSVPLPSLDRPFGIELWPIFSQLWESIKGYPAEDFEFVRGETPMSTLSATAFTIVAYYVTVFGGRELMRNQPAMKLNGLFMAHNLLLTLVSGVLLALFIEQLVPTVWRHGIFFAICNRHGGWTKPLVVLYYVRHPYPVTGSFPSANLCS